MGESHLLSVGRDGAYVESDVMALVTADLSRAKMVTLKAGRIELTDPKHVEDLKAILGTLDPSEMTGMDDSQKGFYVFRKIFVSGLQNTKASLAMKALCRERQ